MQTIIDLKKILGVTLHYDTNQTPAQPFEMEVEIYPGANSGLHVHPQQDEFYHIREGELDLYLKGKWHKLERGREILILKGTKHGFKNTGTNSVTVLNKHIPGLRLQEYYKTMHQMINEGKVSGMAGFKNSIYLSMLVLNYPDIIKLSEPPVLLIKAAAFVGKIMGYKL
jgi:mannose-6-phosphate isomerase-like protein (cupin superfamily)